MPTEIKIILPVSRDDDIVSDDEDNNKSNKDKQKDATFSCNRINGNKLGMKPNKKCAHTNGDIKGWSKEDRPLTDHESVPCDVRQTSNNSETSTFDVYYKPSGQSVQSQQVIAEMAASLKLNKKIHNKPQAVHLSVSEIYDINMEHANKIVKDLQSYSMHMGLGVADWERKHLEVDKRNAKTQSPVNKQILSRNVLAKRTNPNPRMLSGPNLLSKRGYKLSQCRLRFYDDDEGVMPEVKSKRSPFTAKRRTIGKPSAMHKVTAMETLYQLEDSDDLLVDSVGTVYKTKRIRPHTPLPLKCVEYLQMIKIKHQHTDVHRSSEIQPLITSDKFAAHAQRRRSVPSQSSRYTPSIMTDIPHYKAYQKRNRTTHIWTDGSQLMSQSLPTSTFIHQRYASSVSSSPRSSRDANSEKTSPAAGKATATRPSSSYSYDGGFFLGAHAGQAEYFVIHPDWVSEAVTIKKLALVNKSLVPPTTVSKSVSYKSGSWSGRRCLSAPPAKRRNPITWEPSNPIDIPDKQF